MSRTELNLINNNNNNKKIHTGNNSSFDPLISACIKKLQTTLCKLKKANESCSFEDASHFITQIDQGIMKVYEEFIYSNFSGMALQTPVVAVESPSHRMQDGKDNSKNTQKWVCHICEKKFQSASHLTVHRSSHHLKDFPVHCRICFVGFSNMESCKTHELYCKIKRWECFLCHYPASYRNYLEDHMHLHSGVKRFECHICSTNYSTKPHLKRHFETTHLRIRNFQCPVCHSNFGRKQHLLKHQKSKKHFGHKSK